MLDLCYTEDAAAEVDLNLVMNANGEIIEVQGSGEEATFSEAQFTQMLALGKPEFGVCSGAAGSVGAVALLEANLMWKLGVTIPAESEEAASELLGQILKVSPTTYVDVKSGKAHLSFFFKTKPRLDESRDRVLRALWKNPGCRASCRASRDATQQSATRRLGRIVEASLQTHRNRR